MNAILLWISCADSVRRNDYKSELWSRLARLRKLPKRWWSDPGVKEIVENWRWSDPGVKAIVAGAVVG